MEHHHEAMPCLRTCCLALALTVLTLASGCTPGAPPLSAPELLSEWGLFEDLPTLAPAEDTIPFDVVAPLFSDHATKHRFFRLPPGGVVEVASDGRWVFPVGTVLVKTFGFRDDVRDPASPERFVETRLLERTEDGWVPYVYLWNDAGTDATYTPAGRRIGAVELTDDAGARVSFVYRVPNLVQCGNCHGGTGDIEPIGPRTEELDHLVLRDGATVDQIEWLTGLGVLGVVAERTHVLANPADPTESVDARARAYLEANCAHCHRPGGVAHQSGLWLDESLPFDVTTGRCKPPAAAGPGTGGRCVDIMPGNADASILWFRMRSARAGIRMPESGVTLVHDAGVELIREWIDSMPASDCGLPPESCLPAARAEP